MFIFFGSQISRILRMDSGVKTGLDQEECRVLGFPMSRFGSFMQESFRHKELTGKIIGCALKVHNHFGLGFKEEIYERSLLIELRKEGLNFSSQQSFNIYYQGVVVGKNRLDILVEGLVLLELKSVSDLNQECFSRLLNYLKVFNIEVGLLINFGRSSLEFKRFVYSKKSA